MKVTFNQQVTGVSPEQTRASLMPKQEKTMVEQEQPVPVLKPHGIEAQQVDQLAYRQRLEKEKQRAKRVQQYQIRVTETHTRLSINGQVIKEDVKRDVQQINRHRQLTNSFNQDSTQVYDRQQLGLSY